MNTKSNTQKVCGNPTEAILICLKSVPPFGYPTETYMKVSKVGQKKEPKCSRSQERMKAGVFMMASPSPGQDIYESFRPGLEHLPFLDLLVLHEAGIGEHFTTPWEPNLCQDLLIAQRLECPTRIILSPAVPLLPHHHTVELAHWVAFLDNIVQGRFMLDSFKFHLIPYRKPYPPIGMTGASPSSETLRFDGERGFMPVSVALSNSFLGTHWQAVIEGAERARCEASRRDWGVSREVFVAQTDKEAREQALIDQQLRPRLQRISVTNIQKIRSAAFVQASPGRL